MDVLYILGRGSKHDDMELRLSLRCLEKNAIGVDRVFIVGNCPEWVQNVVHIPAEDTYTAENNAFQKVLKACQNGISDEFLLMNDDFFLLESFDIRKYPYFARGFLDTEKPDNSYKRSLNRTSVYLRKFNTGNVNFEVHCPIRFNKHKVMLLEGYAEYFKKQEGVLLRSFYHNIFNSDVREKDFVEDTKNYNDEWKPIYNETGCLSTSDNCDNILKRIEEVYPNKSRWEK